MKETGIRELKAHLSQYLKNVGNGDEIIITDRGKPVARLSSVKLNSENNKVYELLSSMAKKGLIKVPEKWGKPALPPKRMVITGSTISEAVIEDRR